MIQSFDSAFELEIAEHLQASGFRFERDKAAAGIRLDFVVSAPDGRQFIIEAKSGWNFKGYTKRAKKQADYIKRATGADEVFVVLSEAKRSDPNLNVYTLDGLIGALKERIASKGKRRKPPVGKDVDRFVFAAMPFDDKYDDVFYVAMVGAAEECGLTCERVDQIEFDGNIVDKLKEMIAKAEAVLIDLSEAKPNVLYEAGYAHALKKPCIHICSTDLKDLPFDIAQRKTSVYKQGQTHKLKSVLVERLKKTVSHQ